MRHALRSTLVITLVVGVVGVGLVLPSPAEAAGFSDVPSGHEFYADITAMAGIGVIVGYDDGTFRPTAPVSRQAMAAFLWRVKGRPAPKPTAPTFSDVPPGHPFEDAIRWMAGLSFTDGYDDGTFRPTAPVSRQAAAAFLWRAEGRPVPSPGAPAFSDVQPTHPFVAAIRWMADEGITNGYPDGTFRPDTIVTRQAAAAFLHRLYPSLSYSLPPVYGSAPLTAGFLPDPYLVGIVAGGPARADYLGGECSGGTTSAPTYSFNYTAGAVPLLRFYAEAGFDLTLIINGPNAWYYCNDDSFGTTHPTIDFANPSSGRYEVWVGSYLPYVDGPATVFVTENAGNHP